MNQLLNNYGLFVLVLIFIIISLYFKNFLNIGIFLILFVALRIMVEDEKALLYAYCISIFYGIIKNFHLLENFTSNNTNNNTNANNLSFLTPNNSSIKNLINSHNENNDILKKHDELKKLNNNQDNKQSKKTKNKKKINNVKKLNKKEKTSITKKVGDSAKIDDIISEELINHFIKKLKQDDNLLIMKEKINIYKINPTINKLSKNKVNKLKKKMIEDENFAKKPLVISNDNFILDGHHRWYAKKSLIENNTNGYNVGDLYSEEIKVVIIDYNIKKCVQKLQEYKIKYNKEVLNKSIEDINTFSDGKKYLDEIKNMVLNLEKNYNSFANIELVE